MRTAPKIALSLLISILLFAGLAAAAYAGLFNILETRFYQPAVISSIDTQLDLTAKALNDWHTANVEKFATFVNADAVKRTLLPNQSSQDIFDRSNLAGTLLADMPGLTGIRIIDSGDGTITSDNDTGKRRTHFSTFKEDILKKSDFQISYANYGAVETDVPFSAITQPDGAPPKVVVDSGRELFLYCYPFYDSFSSWRGTAVFYVSIRSAAQYLISQNLFRISDDLVLLGDPAYAVYGTVTGMPRAGRAILDQAILDRWTAKNFNTDRLVATDSSGWVLLTKDTGSFGFTSQLVQESLFTFPYSVKILFLSISFITLFLIIFLLFNLKQDEMLRIRNRIRRFQVQLLNELVEKNDDAHWEEIRKNLTSRKHDLSAEIKKGFGKRVNKKHGTEIDALLDKNWEEILSAIGQQENRQGALSSTDELRAMLEQVLQNNAISLNLTGIPAPVAARNVSSPSQSRSEPTDDVEEIEELSDEAEEIEELADEAEEIEELADEAEEIEELADEAEEIEELTDEAEEIEELADEAEEPTKFEELTDKVPVETKPAAPSDDPFMSVDMGPYTDDLDAEDRGDLEPDEVEYLDGEWEPDLLEIASDDDLIEYIDENVPDGVLVYNFEEKPELDSGNRDYLFLEDEHLLHEMVIARPDFSALDHADTVDENESPESTIDDGEASEVDYIETFILNHGKLNTSPFSDTPAFDFLEVTGETAPFDLIDLDEPTETEDGAIVNRDGLFLVSASSAPEGLDSIDPEFKELVDSVLS